MTTIPSYTLNNGITIPAVGFGTYLMTSKQVHTHLRQAIELGYRHIDTANAYFNEVAVGEVIAEVIADGVVTREELFVTSKLFPQSYPYEQAGKDIDATLERLGLDYLDLLLFHQPYGEYVAGWKAMEEAVDVGQLRTIGLSNFNAAQVREITEVARIMPAVDQVEITPRWNRHDLKADLADLHLVFEGWAPLGQGDKELLTLPALTGPAERTGKSPAQVALRWQVQEGNVIFPKTLNPAHMAENIDIFDFELTEEEVAAINAIPERPIFVHPEEWPSFIPTMDNPFDYSQQQ